MINRFRYQSDMVASFEFAVRVRPSTCHSSHFSVLDVDPQSDNVIINNQYSISVDHVFPVYSSQADIFDKFSGSINKFLEGNNVTFITLGRNHSGKSHTLIGSLPSELDDFGIIPRAAKHTFDHLHKVQPILGLEYNFHFTSIVIPRNSNLIDSRWSNEEWIQKSAEQQGQTYAGKECRTYEEFLDWLRNVRDYCLNGNSHKNLILSFTLYQKWMNAGKITSKCSHCSFIELGSIWSVSYGLMNNALFKNLEMFSSGLDVISKVISEIAEGGNSVMHHASPYNLFIDVLKGDIRSSSKTILLYCATSTPLQYSDLLNDLKIIQEIRLKCCKTWFGEVNPCQDIQFLDLQKRDCPFDGNTLSFGMNTHDLGMSNPRGDEGLPTSSQSELLTAGKGFMENFFSHKHELDDWLKQDITGCETVKCSLNRIDEVTESGSRSSNENSADSESDNDDSDEMYGFPKLERDSVQSNVKRMEFSEKLDHHLLRFRTLYGKVVNEQQDPMLKLCAEMKNVDLKESGRRTGSVESLSHPEQPGEKCSKAVVHSPCTDLENNDLRNYEAFHDSKQLVPTGDVPQVDSLRIEIASLRATKGYMHEQKRELTAKMNEKKYISHEEQRKLIEADEAIDAIDSAMEFKNELLCGRNSVPKSDVQEQGARMLTERLLNLSIEEMRILLCKYFRKVVDLREAGHKMEKVIADQDHQLETQAWKIHALTNALRQTRVECDRKVMVMREQEKKYQVNFHHYAEGSSGASSSMDKSDNLSSASAPLLEISGAVPSSNVAEKALTIPHQNLRRLQGSSTHTTKVTRKGNKLIIQQERSKKK